MSARQQLLSHRSIRNYCNGMLEAIIYFYSRYLILDGSQKGHSQTEWNTELFILFPSSMNTIYVHAINPHAEQCISCILLNKNFKVVRNAGLTRSRTT